MRRLSANELHFVNGGSPLIENPVSSMYFLAGMSSLIGGALGAVFYYETLPSAFVQTTLLSTMNVNLVTLPMATFAGFGFGGLLGTAIGLTLYFSGMMPQSD
ncbi:MAG: hypothetical protein AB7I18_09150 [Candidatus Berkiella sp.]